MWRNSLAQCTMETTLASLLWTCWHHQRSCQCQALIGHCFCTRRWQKTSRKSMMSSKLSGCRHVNPPMLTPFSVSKECWLAGQKVASCIWQSTTSAFLLHWLKWSVHLVVVCSRSRIIDMHFRTCPLAIQLCSVHGWRTLILSPSRSWLTSLRISPPTEQHLVVIWRLMILTWCFNSLL